MNISDILKKSLEMFLENHDLNDLEVLEVEKMFVKKLGSSNLASSFLRYSDLRTGKHFDQVDRIYRAGFEQGISLINDLIAIRENREVQEELWR